MIDELKNLTSGFHVAGHSFKWGTTASEINQALGNGQLPMDAVNGKCREAYGFSAISFSAQAPQIGRPILSLSFNLAPYAQDYSANKPEHWSLEIEKVLGKPQHVSINKPGKLSNPSIVIFHASWIVENGHTVSLSVFGGFRPEEAGISVASLFVSWKDEIAAALPYLVEYTEKENFLAGISKQSPSIRVFVLGKRQAPCLEKLGYLFGSPDQSETFQRSRRILRTQNLMVTPPHWKSMLNENSVMLWLSQDPHVWGISNFWDTVFFKAGDAAASIESWNAAPAKGGGYMNIKAGELIAADVFDSANLKKLADAIEGIDGRSITRHETYDD